MDFRAFAVVVVVSLAWVYVFRLRFWFALASERVYTAGDGEKLLRGLSRERLEVYVPHATALGLYREAEDQLQRRASRLLTSPPATELERLLIVNFAETLSELGRPDEALRLTEFTSSFPLTESGRRCIRGWILSAQGRAELALAELEGAESAALGNYQAEYWFTLAFAQLTAGRLDEAEVALQSAKAVLVRASSERNFEFLMAQLRWKQGRRDEALTHFETAAKHRWRWQGGAGLLAWGDALKELGRDDEARAAWAQCIAQDPQSLAAIAARERR